jgi:hypothetical protein
LDGKGIRTTGLAGGRLFDINADGKLDLSSFILGGNGLLAMDRNHNGKIDDGSELFGDQRGASNGFEELHKLDENQDGVVDKNDSAYSALSLLTPSSANPNDLQLTSLAAAGIAALKLTYSGANQSINPGDSIAQEGSFIRNDGTTGVAGDLLLAYRRVQF